MSGEFARIDAVATIENWRRLPLSPQERLRRPGPYPHDLPGTNGCTIDDYTIDGNALLVGSAFDTCMADRTFAPRRICGKRLVSGHYHVLVTKDEDDLDYLEAMLRLTDARPFLEQNPFVDRIDEDQLRDVRVFWPSDKEVRHRICQALRTYDSLLATLVERRTLCEELGDARFDELLQLSRHQTARLDQVARIKRGRPLSCTSVNPVAGYPLFTPLGETGRANDWCVQARSLIMRSSARGISPSWTETPAWALENVSFVEQGPASASPAYLYFALQAAIREETKANLRDHRVRINMSEQEIPLLASPAFDDFTALAQALLAEMHQIDRCIERLRLLRPLLFMAIARGYLPAISLLS